MERETSLKLKLQMGINPSAPIELPVLQAMWRQLLQERGEPQRLRPGTPPAPRHHTEAH